MGNSVETQAYIFFTTLYGGIIIGFIYDLYRIFRYFSRPNKIATLIQDLVFWIIVALIALFILLFSNWGEIRGYVFLGFVSGALLYSRLLSKPVITLLIYIFRFIGRILSCVFKLISYPFKVLLDLIYLPYRKMSGKAKTILYSFKRVIRLPIRIAGDIVKYTRTILQKK